MRRVPVDIIPNLKLGGKILFEWDSDELNYWWNRHRIGYSGFEAKAQDSERLTPEKELELACLVSRMESGVRVRSWRLLSTAIGSCREYPRHGDILQDFRDFMAEINRLNLGTTSADPHLSYFIEQIYFASPAFISLAASTIEGYKDMLRLHLKPLVAAETLAGLRPVTVTKVLDTLAQEKDLSKRTLQHIKGFLSGVYTFARNHGHFDGANPVIGVKIPNSRPPEETYTYSWREELALMKAIKSPAGKLAVAVASWTGVDKGELEALRWEDRVGHDLSIRRKIWCGPGERTQDGKT